MSTRMSIFRTVAVYSSGVVAVVAVAGIVWAVAVDHPARPALKREVDVVVKEMDALAVQVAVNTRESLWVQLNQFERKKARLGTLTGRDCARYLAIAKELGVPAKC